MKPYSTIYRSSQMTHQPVTKTFSAHERQCHPCCFDRSTTPKTHTSLTALDDFFMDLDEKKWISMNVTGFYLDSNVTS